MKYKNNHSKIIYSLKDMHDQNKRSSLDLASVVVRVVHGRCKGGVGMEGYINIFSNVFPSK